jgi:formate dehydrogenase alpha subunit
VLLGAQSDYADSKDVLKEIRSVIPGYGLLGPAPIPHKVDQATVTRYITEGFRQDLSDRYTLAPQAGRPADSLRLELVQSLFHSGKFSTRSKGLVQIEAEGVLRLNPVDATKLGAKDGDRVGLSNERGTFTTTVKLVERVPKGSAWFPDHFAQGVTGLFDITVDANTKVPSFRTTFVSIVMVA